MIIGIVVIVCTVIAGVLVLGANGRPSFARTLCSIPFAVVALSFPFFFEEGCNESPRTYVVARDMKGVLTDYGVDVAWCPKGCVNVPRKIVSWLTLQNGIAFKAEFDVKDAAQLVRMLHLDTVDRVVSPDDVQKAAQLVLRPYLGGYLKMHEEQLLRRALHRKQDLDTTARELSKFLTRKPESEAKTFQPLASTGLEFTGLCCVQVASRSGS
ncbi:MAG: hypothetical protein Q7R80_04905 [bacterium]|nr:hypothetical protein [bacterium]